jgi:outer membrane biosynthesis protein TonB
LVSFKFVDLPDNPSVFEIPDRFSKFIVPEKQDKDIEEKKVGEGEEEKKKKKAKKKKDDEDNEGGGKKKKLSADEKAAREAARRARVRQKVAGKGLLKILGARGPGAAGGEGAISDVFSEGGGAGDLDAAFDGLAGVGIATSAGEGSRRGAGGGEAAGIGDLATEGGGSANVGAKGAARVRGRVGARAVEDVDGSLDPKAITAAIKRRLSGIKRCYEAQLKRNPKLSGKIVVTFVIDERGRVSEARVDTDTMGDRAVTSCIVSLIRRVRFPKPDDGTVQASFPFVFTPAG